SLLKKNEADISELVVIYDDIDIDRYTVRARSSGSAGTHNGMKSIVSNLCSSDFKRIRIGIGRGQGELRDFVLSQIPKEETDKFKESIAVISDALQKYIHDRDFEKLMRQVNTKPQTK
ncbi:MAG: aminoacyl-tRNA hydrolase, partial [Clostridiales bacterium]|nr:aminoacyl-tRNA hydrolase [Clostridiales bacterium]